MKNGNSLLFEILENCYPEEEIFSKSMKIINNSKVVITYYFPDYKRAKMGISYASAVQITPAIFEGLFVAAGNYVKNETNKLIEFSYDEFPEKMWDAIFREFTKLTFLQKIPKEECVDITFEIVNITKLRNFFVFDFKFTGPVRGFAKCLVPM